VALSERNDEDKEELYIDVPLENMTLADKLEANFKFVINENGICGGFYMYLPRTLDVNPSDTELEIDDPP
jgi:hypothetical protein